MKCFITLSIMGLFLTSLNAGILENFGDKLKDTKAYYPYQHFLGKLDDYHGRYLMNKYAERVAGYRVKELSWSVDSWFVGPNEINVSGKISALVRSWSGEMRINCFIETTDKNNIIFHFCDIEQTSFLKRLLRLIHLSPRNLPSKTSKEILTLLKIRDPKIEETIKDTYQTRLAMKPVECSGQSFKV